MGASALTADEEQQVSFADQLTPVRWAVSLFNMGE